MNIKIKEAGDLIDFQCTKCKILTIHTIVAMVAGRVARVKCNTCSGEHNYRTPKAEKALITRRCTIAKAGKSSAPCYQDQWNTALARLKGKTAMAYNMEGRYTKDMIITHPNFGLGVVTSLSYGKMEVFFNLGPKWLGCG